MRTKTDKGQKTAASQRLQFNASLPNVVLDASHCAKLLDGPGKTSVVVVERGGKIVPISSLPQASLPSSSLSPVSQPSSSSSLSSSASIPSSSVLPGLSSYPVASKSKLCKDADHVQLNSMMSTALAASLDRKSNLSVTSDHNINSSNSNVTEQLSTEKEKVILKPPKKRRMNDRGAYEDIASPPFFNGDINHSLTSPLRNFSQSNVPDVVKSVVSSSCSSSSSSYSCALSDSSPKHTIENLLQTQSSCNKNDNNNSCSSNNNLISGRISHRPYEMSSHQLPPAKVMPSSSGQSSLSVLSSLQTPLPSLSQPPSTLSPSDQTPISPKVSSSIAYHGSSHHQDLSNAEGSSFLYTSPPQPLPSQTAEKFSHHLTSTVEQTSQAPILTSSSLSPPLAQSAILQASFQQTPEQDEPINLSTSFKLANGSTSPHAHMEVLKEKGKRKKALQSNSSRLPAGVHSKNDLSSKDSVSVWKDDLKVFSENNGVTQVQRDQEACSPDLNIQNSPTDCNAKNPEKAISRTDSNFIISEDLEEHLPSVTTPLHHKQSATVSKSSLDLIHENNSRSNEQPDVRQKDVTATDDDIEVRLDKNVLTSSVFTHLPSSQISSVCAANISASLDSESTHDNLTTKDDVCDKEMSDSSNVRLLQKETVDKDVVAKIKKPPKKRMKVPLDKESCIDRLARYSGSIDSVITDFIFNPEPVEEFSLTDEEKAIISEQFEESESRMSSAEEKYGTEQQLNSASKLVDTSDLEKENGQEINTPSSRADVSKDLHLNNDTALVAKPPKKRENVMKTSQAKKSCGAIVSVVANIGRVLTFVAADVTNYTPPSEEGMLELDEKYGHLLRKKKKKACPVSENDDGAASKELVQDTSSILKKKTKALKSRDGKLPQKEDVSLAVKKCDTNHQGESNASEENGDAAAPQEARSSFKEVKKVKTKLGKKRKSDLNPPTLSNREIADSKSDVVIASTTENDANTSKPKKKKLDGKTKLLKKKNSEKKTETVSSNNVANPMQPPVSQTLDDRYLSCGKIETSDLGESLASVSGGSEQVTPVHEPETKDEGTSTSMDHGMDKENQDTGGELDLDDNDKPVRHYKKRLEFVKCSQCDHQARGMSALSRHMKKVHLVHEDMPYRCTICTYGCTKMASLNRHLFTHGIFPCSRCDFKTDQRDKLTEHIAETHKDKLDMKLCKVCNRYIKCERLSIEEHSDKCQGPTPFKCTECDKEFKYGSSLRVHYHTHFPNEPKRFKCELCDYRTNYKANLHKHNKNMHASKDRDIQCPDCGKMFSTEDNMRRHRKVHTLARPFACETCKKSFKTSGALKGHQLIHTATRPFTCNIPGCNRSFRTPKFLKSHQEEFHRLVPKKFFCHVDGCNYSFFKRSHLKRHAITHTGERNFHCTWPACKKSFRHADNLKVHFRSHTNDKPVQCHLCDFKCKQKNSLFWHKKKAHQIVDASSVASKRDSAEAKATEPATKEVGVGQAITDSLAHSEKSVTSVGSEEKKPDGEDDSNLAKGDNSSLLRREKADKPTVSSGRERRPADLYEFKSDDESDDEVISPLRRDKASPTALPPLPPAPKELLLKNEREEQKEREKQEKVEQKEKERVEKLAKKELDKKERAEKKEIEKKEKAEKKELEKKEKDERKEQEKKEKEEKKEQEKIEKEGKREQERKEKEEKKELMKKEKDEKREKERKEKEETRLQEKKARLEKCQKEKKEKERRRLEVKRLKMDARRFFHKSSALKKRTSTLKLKKAQTGTSKTVAGAKENKSIKPPGRRGKSPSRGQPVAKVETEPKKPGRGRKKKAVSEEAEENALVSKKTNQAAAVGKKTNQAVADGKKTVGTRRNRSQTGKAAPKEEKQTTSSRSSSPRAASRKSPVPLKAKAPLLVRGGRAKAATPPTRKPSARIKANHTKTETKPEKKVKPSAKKLPPKTAAKKNPGRKKKAVTDSKPSQEEEGEVEEEEEEEEEKKVVDAVDHEKLSTSTRASSNSKNLKEPDVPLASQPTSPAYSEENMLQGNASPYRDFSDAEHLEEEEKRNSIESEHHSHSPQESPKDDNDSASKSLSDSVEDFVVTEENIDNTDNQDVDVNNEECPESCPPEESSDDEVINDIPLTPPRAPAPPPMESSEDEMEPEPVADSSTGESCQPFSVPAPNTPFSVPGPNTPFSVPGPNTPFSQPGPNTPFSVPPPTNLMQQQHSVHSEEMPMSAAVPSVASLEIPSVEMQQTQGSVEMVPHGSVEMHHHDSVEMHHHDSVEIHSHGSVERLPRGSVEMHSHGSVERIPRGSVEMNHHDSVEMHPHGSVERNPRGSVEMHHHDSVEMLPIGSVERIPRGSVEMHHHDSVEMLPVGSVERIPRGSVEMHHHDSVEMHPRGSVEMHPHGSVEMQLANNSVEINRSHNSVEMQPSHSSISEPLSQTDSHIAPQSNMPSELPPTSRDSGSPPSLQGHDKYGLPPVLEDAGQASEADRKYFDQYLKSFSVASHSNLECPTPSGLQQLEAMVGKSHSDVARDLMSKSPQQPINHHLPAIPTSVITSIESSLPPHMAQQELRARIDPLTERHHESSLYSRDSMSALPRFPDRQSTATPLLSNHATPTPAFDTFSSLNPLHPTSVSSRDNSSYLRQQETIFATPPVTSSFMAEAMFQRQAMTTPFLPTAAQSTDRSSLSRIPDPASTLRTNNASSLLRRPTTMPGSEMFTAPTVPQAMPRHPFPNVWPGQEVRPPHWQSPYLPRQPNMGHSNSPFFPPTKENYLSGREFMFDTSSAVRSSTERGMFSALSSSQTQDSFQMDRFDISNYFPNPMTPYGSSPGTLDYTRSSHTAAPKPFDERYRQSTAVAAAATAATIPEFRGLPPTTAAAPEMFPSIGVNSSFNLYPSNPMSYHHTQHMTDNMNSAFLTHSSPSAQHMMLERDYAVQAAAAHHRGLYPHHQNAAYPFIDDRQYSGSSKLGAAHPTVPTSVTQERDLMSRAAAPEGQMQDPYRSMLYRY